MTVGALLVARLSSSRFPQKNIQPILGKPMIEQLALRVRKSKCVDRVIVTTSVEPSDDPLEELAKQIGIDCYRGPLDNVMERIVGAARAFNCDHIIEILGDNPLVHSELIDDVFELYQEAKCDYAATVTNEYEKAIDGLTKFSIGLRVQIYSRKAAEDYTKFPEYQSNGKHPCAYIFDHPEIYKLAFLEAKDRWQFLNIPELNFAVNYRKNFDFVSKVFESNYPQNENFPLDRVINQIQEQRHLISLLGSE